MCLTWIWEPFYIQVTDTKSTKHYAVKSLFYSISVACIFKTPNCDQCIIMYSIDRKLHVCQCYVCIVCIPLITRVVFKPEDIYCIT